MRLRAPAKLLLTLILASSAHPSVRAEELYYPRTLQEAFAANPGAQWGEFVHLRGGSVVYKNRRKLEAKFPFLKGLPDDDVNRFLLRNYNVISRVQLLLQGIRMTRVEIEPGEIVRAVRPLKWDRSAQFGAIAPDGSEAQYVVDGKGIGLREDSPHLDEIQGILRVGMDQVPLKQVEDLRIKDHSDGLMTLGEAIAELTRQTAVQMTADIENVKRNAHLFETTETDFIIDPGFDIIKKGGERVRAGFYFRDGQFGRIENQGSIRDVYFDHKGKGQRTWFRTIVDLGGAFPAHPSLFPQFGSDPNQDPQSSNAWKYGHDTAKAIVERGDPGEIDRHLMSMTQGIRAEWERTRERAEELRREDPRARIWNELREGKYRGNEILKVFRSQFQIEAFPAILAVLPEEAFRSLDEIELGDGSYRATLFKVATSRRIGMRRQILASLEHFTLNTLLALEHLKIFERALHPVDGDPEFIEKARKNPQLSFWMDAMDWKGTGAELMQEFDRRFSFVDFRKDSLSQLFSDLPDSVLRSLDRVAMHPMDAHPLVREANRRGIPMPLQAFKLLEGDEKYHRDASRALKHIKVAHDGASANDCLGLFAL